MPTRERATRTTGCQLADVGTAIRRRAARFSALAIGIDCRICRMSNARDGDVRDSRRITHAAVRFVESDLELRPTGFAERGGPGACSSPADNAGTEWLTTVWLFARDSSSGPPTTVCAALQANNHDPMFCPRQIVPSEW